MKQRIALLIIGLALISGYQAFAQKKQISDYNFRKAIELVDKGDEVEALKYVNEQISETPEFSDAYVLRAQLYYQQAIEDATEVLKSVSTVAYPYYLRGWSYELSGDDERAMADYNAGIDVDKTYPYIYLMRGELYLKHGEKDKADADKAQAKLDRKAERQRAKKRRALKQAQDRARQDALMLEKYIERYEKRMKRKESD